MKGLKGIHLEQRIRDLLSESRNGRTALQIKDDLSFFRPVGIASVRKVLRNLIDQDDVEWFAEWYGKNAGYTRVYKIKNK